MQTRPNMWKMSLGVVALCRAWVWETGGEAGGGGVCVLSALMKTHRH